MRRRIHLWRSLQKRALLSYYLATLPSSGQLAQRFSISTNLFFSSHGGVNCTGFRWPLIWVEAVVAFWLQEQSKCAEQPGGRVWEDIIIKAIKRRSKCTEQPRGGVWEDKWGTGGLGVASMPQELSRVEVWKMLIKAGWEKIIGRKTSDA